MTTAVLGADLTDPLLLAWEARLRRLKRDPRTITNFRYAARRFETYLRNFHANAAQAEGWMLEEFFAELDLAPSSKRKILADVRAAYRYAQRRGAIEGDPTAEVQIERIPDVEPRVIPHHALRDMRARIAGDRPWLMFHLLAFAGLRRAEVRGLRWEDVDLGTQTLRVRGKAGKLRLVPIHPQLGEALAEARRIREYVIPGRYQGPVSIGTLSAVLDEFTEEYTAHDFRRTVASSLYANGVETDTIDKIMGWAPRAVRSRYYVAHAPAQLQRAILRLYADDPV